MRVLIVKTSSMGDVLHTLPALTDAQQAIPGIKFDWVVEEGFAQIPSWHAAVERVIPVAIRRWRKAWFSAPIKAERKAFREALQAENYDAVIDAQGLVKSAALVTRLAHGVKHGLDWQTVRGCVLRRAAVLQYDAYDCKTGWLTVRERFASPI
ncbi:lipopolysaccharide heptosyltransferase I, partial [Escherichia coli]